MSSVTIFHFVLEPNRVLYGSKKKIVRMNDHNSFNLKVNKSIDSPADNSPKMVPQRLG